jgi:hypothetical protein
VFPRPASPTPPPHHPCVPGEAIASYSKGGAQDVGDMAASHVSATQHRDTAQQLPRDNWGGQKGREGHPSAGLEVAASNGFLPQRELGGPLDGRAGRGE